MVLPGHESRFVEAPSTSIHDLVPRVAPRLLPFLDQPYALFGHSMGGLLAFALTEYLTGVRRAPRTLVLSACRPDRDTRRPLRHTLTDGEFLDELRAMNGTPPEFFADPSMIELLLPVLRADFAAAETFEVAPGRSVDVPVVALAGTHDASVPPSSVEAWQRHTTGSFRMSVVPGDHFFIHDTELVARSVLAAMAVTMP